jgi:hypothetical protein
VTSQLNDDRQAFPIDPRTAVINFSKYLLEFEKSEILDYDKVYFIPTNNKNKNRQLTTPDGVDNNGFDNDKNEYIT